MRCCPKCGTEYRDDVAVCSEDGTALLDPKASEAFRSRAQGHSFGRLTTLVTLDNRFEAEELADGLADERLHPSVVSSRTRTIATLVAPGPEAFSIVVLDSEAERGRALLTEWRPEFEASHAEAERAAEEEEAKTEKIERH